MWGFILNTLFTRCKIKYNCHHHEHYHEHLSGGRGFGSNPWSCLRSASYCLRMDTSVCSNQVNYCTSPRRWWRNPFTTLTASWRVLCTGRLLSNLTTWSNKGERLIISILPWDLPYSWRLNFVPYPPIQFLVYDIGTACEMLVGDWADNWDLPSVDVRSIQQDRRV